MANWPVRKESFNSMPVPASQYVWKLGYALECETDHHSGRLPGRGTIVRPFEKQHWLALQMLLADPDGRQLAVDAPLPSTKRSSRNSVRKGKVVVMKNSLRAGKPHD
jgi:hypothetical protein